MTIAEEEFWSEHHRKEEYEERQSKNISSANKVIAVLTVIVALVWGLVKL